MCRCLTECFTRREPTVESVGFLESPDAARLGIMRAGGLGRHGQAGERHGQDGEGGGEFDGCHDGLL